MIQFDLNLTSKYRSEIMGVATIMIVICHAPHYMSLPSLLSQGLSFWSVGVDVFLFLSGLGLCYSYDKKKVSVGSWYRKRFFRILLPCLIIQLLFVRNEGIVDFIKFFTGISFWTDHRGFWFVDLLMVLYLVFPVLFRISKWPGYRGIVTLSLLCLFLYILPNIREWDSAIMINISKVCQYIPSFVLGILVFPLVQEHKKIDLRYIFPICLFGAIVFILLSHLIQWQLYPGVFYSCIIVLVSSLIFGYVPIGLKTFAFFGKISLESYLINVSFPMFLLRNVGGIISNDWWFYPAAVVVGLVIAIIVNKISQTILSKLKW